jgi:hypothetical protein
MWKTLKPFLVTMPLALSLSGCFTAPAQSTPPQVKEVPGPTRVVDNSCLYFRQETPTDADVKAMSRPFLDQVTANIKMGIQHCGWKYGK